MTINNESFVLLKLLMPFVCVSGRWCVNIDVEGC